MHSVLWVTVFKVLVPAISLHGQVDSDPYFSTSEEVDWENADEVYADEIQEEMILDDWLDGQFETGS